MSKQGRQKQSKNVEAIAALRAFETTFKAACRFHGVAPHNQVLTLLQQCQDSSTPCDKLSLTSTAVEKNITSAVTECLSSYEAVKSLCFYGCDMGDEGLSAVAALLRASASRWWRGCKLRTLEICADGRQLPVTPPLATPAIEAEEPKHKPKGVQTAKAPATEQTAAQIETAAEAASNHLVPRHALENGGTPDGSMHSEPAKAVPSSGVSGATNPCSTSSTLKASSTHGMLLSMQPLAHQQQPLKYATEYQQPPPGVCPPVPRRLQLNFPNHMQLAQQALNDRVGSLEHVRYKSQPPRPLVTVKRLSLQALQDWKVQQQQQQQETPARQPNAALQFHAVIDQQLQQQVRLVIQSTTPPMPARLQAETCPRFSAGALQDLSLSLGVAGLSLVRLALDHTLMGDAGVAWLAAGLRKCTSLKQLSLCYCGFRAAGVKELAAALAPGAYTDAPLSHRSSAIGAGAGTSRLATGSSSALNADSEHVIKETAAAGTPSTGLQLQQLLLSGNELAGSGLQALNPALRAMTALEVLGLSDIGITEADKVQLQGLVHALTVGPSQLARLDFDANYIGDRVASLFLALLPNKPSLVLLKLTGRLSNETVIQLLLLQQHNLKLSKPKKTKKNSK